MTRQTGDSENSAFLSWRGRKNRDGSLFLHVTFSFYVYNSANWRAFNFDFIRHFCKVRVITIDRQFIIVSHPLPHLPRSRLFSISNVIMSRKFIQLGGGSPFRERHVGVGQGYDRTREHHQRVSRGRSAFHRHVAAVRICECQLVDLYRVGGDSAILAVFVRPGALRYQQSLGSRRRPKHHAGLQLVVPQTDQSLVQSSVRLCFNVQIRRAIDRAHRSAFYFDSTRTIPNVRNVPQKVVRHSGYDGQRLERRDRNPIGHIHDDEIRQLVSPML